MRLDVRVRAIGGGLRFEVGIAHAERSRQCQLERSEEQERKSGAFDQVINPDCLTTLAIRKQCTFRRPSPQQTNA